MQFLNFSNRLLRIRCAKYIAVAPSRKILNFTCMLIGLVITFTHKSSKCQDLKPGLPGMSPSKWIKMSNTHAPGRVYGTSSGSNIYTQEDFYFKMWLPIIHKSNFDLLIGPNYRIEQLEFKGSGDNPMQQMAHWQLHSKGLDLTSVFKVNPNSWMMFRFNAKQSANIISSNDKRVPIDYTFSTMYMRKKSMNKEMGIGVLANRTFTKVVAFPILLFDYNFSSKMGVEILLPYKVAWRYNATPSNIFYLQAETMSRSYYLAGTSKEYAFRRTELDLGLGYNRKINKLLGVELFGGYRQNISTRLPSEIRAVKTSGMVFSVELYLKSPFK